jgi:glucose-1-phosphate thymidylyltransferase
MKALILAAGYGTRLYPLTKEYPKALLPVAKRPILDYIVEKISEVQEISELVVITNDKYFPQIQEWAKKFDAQTPARIKILNDGTKTEHDRKGAIGDIYFAISKESIRDDLLILGGDNLFEDSLDDFMEFAPAKKPAATIAVYDIRQREQASLYGVVKLDAVHKIIDFAEKPRVPQSSLIATCLYYIPAQKLGYFGTYLKDLQSNKDSAGGFISWLSKREAVYGFVFKKRWYDIGEQKMYQEADRMFNLLRNGGAIPPHNLRQNSVP